MKTTKNEVKEIAKAKVITKKENKADSATTKVIALSELKERKISNKENNFLYNFQLNKTIESNPKIEKQKRNKIRRDLTIITNKIIVNELSKDKDKADKQKELIKEFNSFYKATYIVNDYSLKSLTNKTNEDDIKDYTFILNLCKENLQQKK